MIDVTREKLRAGRTLLRSLFFLLVTFFAIPTLAAMAETDQTSSTASSRPAVHIVYTETPRDEDPKDFHIRTLASVLGRFVSYFSSPIVPVHVFEMKKKLIGSLLLVSICTL